jgi:hypothetical protein
LVATPPTDAKVRRFGDVQIAAARGLPEQRDRSAEFGGSDEQIPE